MTQRWTVWFFAVLLGTAVTVEAQSTADFTVTFDGLIMHVFPVLDANGKPVLDPNGDPVFDIPNPRALVVNGNALTKHHYPQLIVPRNIDIAALGKATGQPVFCDTTNCTVAIKHFSMRVGTADGSASASLVVNRSFKLLTPHMACVTNKGGILKSVATSPSEAPIAGFFELVGGYLDACAFPDRAFFRDDYDHEGLRFFANRVTLKGTVASGAATLQIKQYLDTDWQVIPINNPIAPLEITISNHAKQGTVSSAHFVLNHKIVFGKDPFPIVCPEVPDGQETPECGKPAPSRPPDTSEDGCFPKENQADESKNLICKGANSPPMTLLLFKRYHLEAMAGCANTQWP